MNDAATLIGMLADEFQATYAGNDRAAYLAALRSWVADLGAEVDETQPAVVVGGRRIAIVFGPISGHR